MRSLGNHGVVLSIVTQRRSRPWTAEQILDIKRSEYLWMKSLDSKGARKALADRYFHMVLSLFQILTRASRRPYGVASVQAFEPINLSI